MSLIVTNKKLGSRVVHAFAFGSIALCVLAACSSSDNGGGGDGGVPPSTNDGGSSSGGDTGLVDSPVGPQQDATNDQSTQNDSSPGHDSSNGDATCGTFTAHGDDVTDSSTGLVWKRTILGNQNYGQGVAACAAWASGGRLPTKDELVAVVPNEEKCKTALGWTDPFNQDPAWTSTPYPTGQNNYYTVYFDPQAAPVSSPAGDTLPVRCVR
jgi:hypothetical protein